MSSLESNADKYLIGSWLLSGITYLSTQLDLVYRLGFDILNQQLARTFDNYAGDTTGPYATYFMLRTILPDKFLMSPVKTASLIY